MATYDVIYSLRGDAVPGRVALVTGDRAAAFRLCRDPRNLPAGTIHYAITCDDGTTLWDTRKDGLLPDAA